MLWCVAERYRKLWAETPDETDKATYEHILYTLRGGVWTHWPDENRAVEWARTFIQGERNWCIKELTDPIDTSDYSCYKQYLARKAEIYRQFLDVTKEK
jgi:hypothetical protein